MLFELRMMTLAVLAVMFVIVVIMLRKQKLELKYCLIWLVALIGVTLFCIFPGLLDSISALLGIAAPVNTFFLICIAFLACICISLTVIVSTLSNKIRELTQNMAIQEYEKADDTAGRREEPQK